MAEHDHIEIWTYDLKDQPTRWAWACGCGESGHGCDDPLAAVEAVRIHLVEAKARV